MIYFLPVTTLVMILAIFLLGSAGLLLHICSELVAEVHSHVDIFFDYNIVEALWLSYLTTLCIAPLTTCIL